MSAPRVTLEYIERPVLPFLGDLPRKEGDLLDSDDKDELSQFSSLADAIHMADLEAVSHILSTEYINNNRLNEQRFYGKTALSLAVKSGNAAVVRLLLQHGADHRQVDWQLRTPLLAAVMNHNVECAGTLLEHGAHPDGDMRAASSPLFYASMFNELDLVRLLIVSGADVDSIGRSERVYSSPLEMAVVYHHYQVAKMLLVAGASPQRERTCKFVRNGRLCTENVRYRNGESLYHVAVISAAPPQFVQLLYDHGARLHVTCDQGLHPQDAYSRGDADEARQKIRQLCKEPRSLQSACRLHIRELVGRLDLCDLRGLPLPPGLINYLHYNCHDRLPRISRRKNISSAVGPRRASESQISRGTSLCGTVLEENCAV